MAFEITAAKRRPQKFSELAGQTFVVSTLMSSIRQERIAHAYLFSGPRGVGKTSAARILAKSLNCEKGITENPCGVCPSCHEITAGRALDVIEIDGASNTSVNDVRAIKDEVLFAPNSSRYKIYIIDEVHMLSNSAFNALLKTIEEPPPYVIFIFATTEVHKVPATIRSRCQQFHFQLISLEVIEQLLEEASKEAGIDYEEEALFWIAKEATGSLRDAYTLFDQIVSFSDGDIRMSVIRKKMGLVGVDMINQIAEALVSGQRSRAIDLLHEILAQGVSVEKCIIDLTEYFRTVLLIKEGISKEAILGAKPEQFSPSVVGNLESEQIEAALDLLLNLYRSIRYSLNQRFELELAISRLSSIRRSASPSMLVKKIESLKNELLAGGSSAGRMQRPTDTSPETERPVPPERTDASPSGLPAHSEEQQNREIQLQAKHIEILQARLKQRSPSLASTLQQITSWDVEDRHISLVFASQFAAEHAGNRLKELREQLGTILGAAIELTVSTKQNQQRRVESQAAHQQKDDTVELVKNIFRGEIYTKDHGGN